VRRSNPSARLAHQARSGDGVPQFRLRLYHTVDLFSFFASLSAFFRRGRESNGRETVFLIASASKKSPTWRRPTHLHHSTLGLFSPGHALTPAFRDGKS
jgi:hypothetical protein